MNLYEEKAKELKELIDLVQQLETCTREQNVEAPDGHVFIEWAGLCAVEQWLEKKGYMDD